MLIWLHHGQWPYVQQLRCPGHKVQPTLLWLGGCGHAAMALRSQTSRAHSPAQPNLTSHLPCTGAWACSALKLVASNTVGGGRKPGDRFVEEVRMWVYEEEVEGR